MTTIDRVTLDDFVDDKPWLPEGAENAEVRIENQIAGVDLRRLEERADGRGSLVVLMSDRFGESYRTPHVYLVTAAARRSGLGSITSCSLTGWLLPRAASALCFMTCGRTVRPTRW